MSETALRKKKGGGVVFVAIFLGPFVAVASVILTRVLPEAPTWAPLVALALAHWVLVALFIQKRARETANVFVWSAGAVLADLMWFGVLLSLVDAYG